MIVDEEGNSSTGAEHNISEQYVFMTSDEPFKMSTLRPAQRPKLGLERQRDEGCTVSERPTRLASIRRQSELCYPERRKLGADSTSGNFLRGADHTVRFNDLNLEQQFEPPIGHEESDQTVAMQIQSLASGTQQPVHRQTSQIVYGARKYIQPPLPPLSSQVDLGQFC